MPVDVDVEAELVEVVVADEVVTAVDVLVEVAELVDVTDVAVLVVPDRE